MRSLLRASGIALVFVAAAAFAAELHEGSPKVAVQMTAATLGDDCGGGRPSVPTKIEKTEKSDRSNSVSPKGKRKRRCEQTSMQLSVVASADVAATDMRVKKVELFDESGKLVGELVPGTPAVWSETGAYVPWNEKIAPAKTLSVTYALSEPDWSKVSDRWNQTFVVKAVVTVGGVDQTVEHDVEAAAETSLPPGVKT